MVLDKSFSLDKYGRCSKRSLRRSLRTICAYFSVVLVFFAFVPFVWAAGKPPPELRKLHALLIIDTNSGLGESVVIDGGHIEHLLTRGIPKDRLNLTTFKNKDVTPAKILNYYRTLKSGPNDALFLFYAGHGATDPQKGHWLALQEDENKPLLRRDLLAAMKQRNPGLIVVLTDCCSNRFKIPGAAPKKHPRGEPSEVDPVLSCLLLRHRGVVDITASTDNAAFGDDHEGGLFTRSVYNCLTKSVQVLDKNQDGFVSWSEAFPLIQAETGKNFTRWAAEARSRHEKVEQSTQKPRAFTLPDGNSSSSLTLVNKSKKDVRYQYRWEGQARWESATLAADKSRVHTPPAGKANKEAPRLEVKFETGETGTLEVGKSYQYTEKKK